MTLLYLVIAWVAGLFLEPQHGTTWYWLVLALGAVGIALWQRGDRFRRLAPLCLMMFSLGAARYAWAARPLGTGDIGSYADTGFVSFTGVIVRDPDVRDQHVNLTVAAESLSLNHANYPVKGVVLVQAPRYGEYSYGDRIRARGFLLTPPEFDDFSYRDYLARRGIHALMANAQVDHLASNQGTPWMAALFRAKDRALRVINQLLPSPEAPLLSGILLGVESEIPASVRDDFNITGTAHIIAISGANIIIVIQVLLTLLTPLMGKRYARLLTIGGVAGYAALVGGDAAVVRAAIMGRLTLMALQSGRRAHGLTSFAFSIWLMTLWNPYTLWDIGFQLSVAATLGLIVLNKPLSTFVERALEQWFDHAQARAVVRHLNEPLIISFSAQIATTPLVLVYFGRLSLIALVANALIVPVQPLIMILGWLAALMGIIWQPLGEVFAWIAWLPLTYTLQIVESLADVKWAALDLRLESSYAWLIYSLLFGIALLLIQHRDDRAALLRRVSQRFATLVLLGGAAITAALLWLVALSQPDGRLHVWFLDVGHGHAVLIQTPRGAQILVDGGPNPTMLRQAIGDALPFWDHDLDVLIVSQLDSGTINALPALLDRYTTRLVLTNGQSTESDSYQALLKGWQQQKTQVIPVFAGYGLQTGDGVTLSILHPQVLPAHEADAQETSLVIRLQYGDASFLLVNDLTPESVEEMRAAGWYVGSTVMELASHGSARANSPDFIAQVNPQLAVVGIGAGQRSPLPAPEVETQIRALTGHPIYRTDHDGTIEITTDGSTLWLEKEN